MIYYTETQPMQEQDHTQRERQEKLSCPQCEGDVVTKMHKDTVSFGAGNSKIEPSVVYPVRECKACQYQFLDYEAEKIKHEALCRHIGVLTPEEIRAIRTRQGMSQASFAQLTGLGEATLSRWENGILIQTHANDRYLRLLNSANGLSRLRSIVRRAGRNQDALDIDVSTRFLRVQVTPNLKKENSTFELHRLAA